MPASNWMRACRCRAPIRAAPLILSRTAVVLCSLDGSITSRFERVDRLQLRSSADQAQLAGVVGRGDGRGVGQVHGRQPRLNDASCRGVESTEQPLSPLSSAGSAR